MIKKIDDKFKKEVLDKAAIAIKELMNSDSIETNKVRHKLQAQEIKDNKTFIYANTPYYDENNK